MIIKVKRQDGRTETIKLQGRMNIVPGPKLTKIVCEDGIEHWFTHTGEYDGWGMNVEKKNLTISAAQSLSKEIEAGRLIEP